MLKERPEPETQPPIGCEGMKKNYQSQNVDPQVGFMSKICANSCLATDSYLNTDLWCHKHLTAVAEGRFKAGALQTRLVWPSSQITVTS